MVVCSMWTPPSLASRGRFTVGTMMPHGRRSPFHRLELAGATADGRLERDFIMLDNHKSLGCTAVLLLLVVGVAMTEAQEVAGSFEQLRSSVRVGDKVTVTDVMGREMQGTIAELSSSSLALVVGKTRTEFFEADLESVSRRDSRWNGTLWGLAVGAVVGAAFEKSFVDEYGRDDIGYGSAVVPFAGIGAGIGFAVDAMIKGRRVVYSRPSTSTMDATISPVWNTRHKGIFVSLRF